tara:strand:+ start:1056 stop:3605 length:2550 start_codon:yes stop_codon:yes gene_type:complete
VALLGNLTGSSQFFSDDLFYNGVATQSLRFDDGSSAYLTRTPSSASNRRTFTFSAWIKRGVLDANNVGGSNDTPIFSAASANGQPFDVLRTLSQLTAGANILQLYANPSSGTDYSEETNASIRDTSAWYHIVMAVDTTQSTAGNRVKFYINGTLQTAVGQYYAQVPQNHDFHFNNTVAQEIGRNAGNTARYFDGYMAEVNFVDGTQYAASDFGETKNGVWIAKKPNVTYGTEGFRLEFNQVGVGTASTSTIGADTSGNNNHFTSSGIVASDCNIPDSPENNFATGNPLIPIPSGSLSEGNLAYVRGSEASHGNCGTTFALPTTGKWYWEVMSGKSANNETIGVANILDHNPQLAQTGDHVGERTGDYVYRTTAIKMSGTNVAGGSSYGATYTGGDVIGVAWSSDDGTITFYKNNASQGTAYSSITQAEGKYVPAVSQAETSSETVFNFGQDSSFAGHKSAQGNTDGNGIGDFYYAPPSGYLALCSSNLSEPTIGPTSTTQADDHFNTVIYSGSSGSQTITTGLQPDWIWIKVRSLTGYHNITDTSRGITKELFLNTNDDEENTGRIESSSTTGFTFPSTEYGHTNENGQTFVSWNWHANGGSTTANDASATGVGSIDSVYQANTTAGFSIVTYTGSSSGTDGTPSTIAHGLGAVPKWILFLPRDQYDGCVYHGANTSAPATDRLILKASTDGDAQSATSDDSLFFNDTEPTSTVFSVGTRKHANSNGGMVAYCFADVEGYSKFGGFVGNGSTDGTFIYTGFRPAWFMFKRTDASATWFIYDNKRDPDNRVAQALFAETSGAESEQTGGFVDFVSNGVKLREDGSAMNASGGTFIYMAFAEAPFKYANAR